AGARRAPVGGDPRGVSRRVHLRTVGRESERAARHHEELDSARVDETSDVSRAMSDEDTIDAGEHGNLTAAEYVLRVLGAQERRPAEVPRASEPRFPPRAAFREAA